MKDKVGSLKKENLSLHEKLKSSELLLLRSGQLSSKPLNQSSNIPFFALLLTFIEMSNKPR